MKTLDRKKNVFFSSRGMGISARKDDEIIGILHDNSHISTMKKSGLCQESTVGKNLENIPPEMATKFHQAVSSCWFTSVGNLDPVYN